MKHLHIIVDEESPLIHLLNSADFEVIPTSKEDTFAMTRKYKGGVTSLKETVNNSN